MRYHGVAQDEDWQLWVAGLHQVDVLQRVPDVNLEILDVHPLPFALTVTHCLEREREEEKGMCEQSKQREGKLFTIQIQVQQKRRSDDAREC